MQIHPADSGPFDWTRGIGGGKVGHSWVPDGLRRMARHRTFHGTRSIYPPTPSMGTGKSALRYLDFMKSPPPQSFRLQAGVEEHRMSKSSVFRAASLSIASSTIGIPVAKSF